MKTKIHKSQKENVLHKLDEKREINEALPKPSLYNAGHIKNCIFLIVELFLSRYEQIDSIVTIGFIV
ncbi:hypothetical protein J2S19_002327 [Metabacillus malikii]|uniref:Uncharacterized protein n=1 Tax=Metabacillus malikii TaxID=1504265 RepID=A0ABT9ZGZ1_9BACI|nr:hypothetical protein [Metabacillus malikii]